MFTVRSDYFVIIYTQVNHRAVMQANGSVTFAVFDLNSAGFQPAGRD